MVVGWDVMGLGGVDGGCGDERPEGGGYRS